jgi:hypothetical protein
MLLFAALVGCTSAPDTDGDTDPAPTGLALRAITFNTGTTEGLAHDPAFDGYGPEQAEASDAHYGDGLAWRPAIEAVRSFLAEADADVVGFQEVFDPNGCAGIPEDAWPGFVCETWQTGDPTVAEEVAGTDYDVLCHPGNTDKCVAIHHRLGRAEGPMEGEVVEGCGSGVRVARAVLPELTLVHVHGSSGLSGDDEDCRTRQIETIFGPDGLATGPITLILGDLNTDPGRWGDIDDSAATWNANVGGDAAFQWVTDVGPEAVPTYQGIANIDHMASDGLTGSCTTPGVTEGAPVYGGVYFDHHPIVCDLVQR